MTNMNKLKTSKLTGTALDWAVAKCEWVSWTFETATTDEIVSDCRYSTDWSQGGPIIDREGINVCIRLDEPHYKISPHRRWYAQMDGRVWTGYGHTPLIAAMRCYVASKLGDWVDVPEELL